MLLKWFCSTSIILFITAQLFTLHSQEITAPLSDLAPIKQLSSESNNSLNPITSSVKGVYELSSQKLYLIPSKYQHHFDYCKLNLAYKFRMSIFNLYNYTPGKQRRFICFNFNILNKNNTYVDFSVGDEIQPQNLKLLYEKIRSVLPRSITVKILANTEAIRTATSSLPDTAILSPDELFTAAPLQILNDGEATGVLHRENDKVKDKSIVILSDNFITPPVADGYIVTKRVTPLSHIVLLAHSQKAPLVYMHNIDSLSHLLGKSVTLSLKGNRCSIKEAMPQERSRTYRPSIDLPVDTNSAVFLSIDRCSYAKRNCIGYKAANFAELCKLQKDINFLTPEGAAVISMKAYADHVKKVEIGSIITSITEDNSQALLKIIRQRIKREKMDSIVLQQVMNHLKLFPQYETFRFRSSSNAEDVIGFSGAGLYTSRSAQSTSIIEVEEAIKKVWASLWSERAYEERERNNIKQSTAAMAILLHRAFPSEELNGVVITENLYKKKADYGYVFNIQKGDIPVVTTDTSTQTELSVSYFDNFSDFYNRTSAVDYLQFSSFNNGPLLSRTQTREYTLVFKKLEKQFHQIWNSKKEFKSFSVDIEFKLDNTQHTSPKLYIKQIRPY